MANPASVIGLSCVQWCVSGMMSCTATVGACLPTRMPTTVDDAYLAACKTSLRYAASLTSTCFTSGAMARAKRRCIIPHAHGLPITMEPATSAELPTLKILLIGVGRVC